MLPECNESGGSFDGVVRIPDSAAIVVSRVCWKEGHLPDEGASSSLPIVVANDVAQEQLGQNEESGMPNVGGYDEEEQPFHVSDAILASRRGYSNKCFESSPTRLEYGSNLVASTVDGV
mmetsp:Transcript_21470/g.32801  ORF Transcript_21470/g.32801 Transcript_21470/m.32801 type:complete len:119 (-) Transcript_21470:314-670(-)